MPIRTALFAVALVLPCAGAFGQAAGKNQVAGTWRRVSATIDPGGRNSPACGLRLNSPLIHTPDMHFAAVLTDADSPCFASDARGEGTDEENRAAMSRSIGFFGPDTVDENGAFSGNKEDGATFPNWVGSRRAGAQRTFAVEGDRMREQFRRPRGTRIEIAWERVR